MRRLFFSLALAAVVLLVAALPACSSGPRFRYERDRSLLPATPAPYPSANFIVFSDPHIFPGTLGTEGPAFEEYILQDRKLLRESVPILESVIAEIRGVKADFVIVPGDLTKDGELVSHAMASSLLSRIEAAGKPVYVVPGNHDILNPNAFSYSGDKAEPVPGVSPEEFARIYGQFGYDEALYRDPNSLSYVVEPVKGLWLLALDACLYRENEKADAAVTGGAFTNDTFGWIEERLIEAARSGKAVIAMMHHGVLEHFPGQQKYFEDYIVQDSEAVAHLLASYDVRLVFTGHFHAQDIAEKRWEKEGKFLYDVETGSLVTAPCPYRFVSLTSQDVVIRSEIVTTIKGYGTGFQEYARAYLHEGMVELAARMAEGYKVKRAPALIIGEQVARAFAAHYAGDERLPENQTAITSKGTGFLGWVIVTVRGGMVKGMWADTTPADNDVTLAIAGE